MRLWSLHPRHLDPQGLVALWREGLLARKVLHGQTRGYTRHPQLQRFRAHPEPLLAMDAYLHAVADEADARGYRFARNKLGARASVAAINVSDAQLAFEWQHLLAKLASRNPEWHARAQACPHPDLHPLLQAVPGPIADWERP